MLSMSRLVLFRNLPKQQGLKKEEADVLRELEVDGVAQAFEPAQPR